MKTNNNGMFIALKYGAAAMAGATASYVFLKQELDSKKKNIETYNQTKAQYDKEMLNGRKWLAHEYRELEKNQAYRQKFDGGVGKN
jgi:hypothetical protein